LAEVLLVPPSVVTVMSTLPAVPDGAVAVSFLAETNVTELAAVVPKLTVAPDTKPTLGVTAVTVGAAARR
jgi:hypothetical protein